MPILLNEADVRALLTMPTALAAVEDAFRQLAEGAALVHSRQRLHMPGKSYLHYMAAGDSRGGYMGLKIYTSSPGGLRFVIPLFDAGSGELLALIEADYLGQMRTGAASGVATKYMARQDAHTIGIVGTGSQARTQLEAVALVRKIASVRAFGRNAERREEFAKEMTERLKLPVTPVGSAKEALTGADIVITSTTANQPVVEGAWLKPGTHINAIGANFPQKRELQDEAIRRCGLIAVDSREQSKIEAGDLIHAFGNDPSRWESVRELAEIVGGQAPGRSSPQEITLFKSNGIAIEDIVVGGRVYAMAKERSIGREIEMWQRDLRSGRGRTT
ncbi:MAG TPA: ornithine cyclodeaminase family protein [Candidatus Acidoferrum sp.]|nr:ornithine cyclodeaminase family protein [Candidatus Acidoferrum sp.]